MRGYTVVVNGKSYDVDVCERDGVVAAPVAAPVAAAPVAAAPVAAAPAARVASGEGDVSSPMPGTVLQVLVKVGDAVQEGTILCTLEALKMENEIVAPCAGTVKEVVAAKGAVVNTGDMLVVIG